VILVTVGTHETPFDRLLRAVAPLVELDELMVQYGSSELRVAGATCVDFLPFTELAQFAADARAVVTHAGAGSVLVALAAGKRPIVMPRIHAFGEAVDDHQLVFARHLSGADRITLVEDPAEMKTAVENASTGGEPPSGANALIGDLAVYLRESLDA
jgi:UDP-N-acetylglucosamine transferase subunit ALG13